MAKVCLLFFPFAFLLFLTVKLVRNESTQLILNDDGSEGSKRILVSTLDGTLFGIDNLSGELLWVNKNNKAPVINVHNNNVNSKRRINYLLPDPRSGSLYIYYNNDSKSSTEEERVLLKLIKKLPFTIKQIVSMAPCRSSEGLLYTGKKIDSWIQLNLSNGNIQDYLSINEEGDKDTCESGEEGTQEVVIGKSEYVLSLLDTKTGNNWNITFNDYSYIDMDVLEFQHNYDFVHFTSPSNGLLLTYSKKTGKLLWKQMFESPVISIYRMNNNPAAAQLVSIPFTSIASQTINNLVKILENNNNGNNKYLSSTIYIGELPFIGLYAVPSFIDNTNGNELIDGPNGPKNGKNELQIGHYDFSINNNDHLIQFDDDNKSAAHKQLDNLSSDSSKENNRENEKGEQDENDTNNNQKEAANFTLKIQELFTPYNKRYKDQGDRSFPVFPPIQNSLKNQNTQTEKAEERKINIYIIIPLFCITTSILAIFYYHYNRKNRKILEIDKEVKTIGKLRYNVNDVIGKGCEGTFVFKGLFENNRKVAIKRILPQCFEIANREVQLLKDTDYHKNVIRYFCTESDGLFKYIALELCHATLHDWIEGPSNKLLIDSTSIIPPSIRFEEIDPRIVLKEATEGLSHLHSLNIIHRDIKPANILLYFYENNGSQQFKTLISDFGLCKKIHSNTSRNNISSGFSYYLGTDGWIAPEMINIHPDEDNTATNRNTYALDVFSMGCIYYYVLTKGKHPFGSNHLTRQSNIVNGVYHLDSSLLTLNDYYGILNLIETMISNDPSKRPPLEVIIKCHPIFWNNFKILNFFSEISDRIENNLIEENQFIIDWFEYQSHIVIHHNNNDDVVIPPKHEEDELKIKNIEEGWKSKICEHLASDLRRFRTYNGNSLRDLLRALRNKKNHYTELPTECQKSLGEIPNEFTEYWLKRFPRLLQYTWVKFEIFLLEGHPGSNPSKNNAVLNYYQNNANYRFLSYYKENPSFSHFDFNLFSHSYQVNKLNKEKESKEKNACDLSNNNSDNNYFKVFKECDNSINMNSTENNNNNSQAKRRKTNNKKYFYKNK